MKIVKFKNKSNSGNVELGWLVEEKEMPELSKISTQENVEDEHLIELMSSDYEVVFDSKEYEKLNDKVQMLAALECVGVDNWSGYETAIEMLEEWNEEQNENENRNFKTWIVWTKKRKNK